MWHNLIMGFSGSLKLANNDSSAKPIMTGNYFAHPMDKEVLIDGIEIALKLFNTTAMRNRSVVLDHQPIEACKQYLFKSRAYWACAVGQQTGPENHQVGSCKMGPRNDPMAVVDPELRVYGIRGLRVADASIMPKVSEKVSKFTFHKTFDNFQIISGNTAAPAMMIGERVTDFIKKDWRGRH